MHTASPSRYTTVDIRRAADNIPHLSRVSAYSPSKNVDAYELSLYSRLDRGTLCEYIVAHDIEAGTGYKCEVTWQRHAWDVSVSVDWRRNPLRIEVKSSLACPGKGRFLCAGIQSRKADIVVLCRIHPVKGLLIDWIEANTVYAYTTDTNWGHSVCFRDDGTCSSRYFNLKTMEELFHSLLVHGGDFDCKLAWSA